MEIVVTINIHLFTEEPLKFTKPLSDQEVTEGVTVILECEVSKPNISATWYKNNIKIRKEPRFQTAMDKKVHTLTIKDVTLDDESEYSIKVGDQTSKANVYIEGKAIFLHVHFV